MFKSTRCYSSGEVFKITLWKNVFRQQAQVLFDRMNDANGKKVQKKVMKNQQLRTTDYFGTSTSLSTSAFQHLYGSLDFVHRTEGYVKAVHTGSATEYHYVYNYTDHTSTTLSTGLGNIRLSYGRDPVTGEIAILKENHYYPFGLEHQGYVGTHKTIGIGIGKVRLVPVRNYLDDSYRYTFGGKEEQPELGLNWMDFHARNYDAALGRTMTVDPLADDPDQVDKSPYA